MPSRPSLEESPPAFSSLQLEFVEDLFARYLRDAGAVPADWRKTFDALCASNGHRSGGVGPGETGREGALQGHPDGSSCNPGPYRAGPSFRPRSIFHGLSAAEAAPPEGAEAVVLQDRVDQLIRAYRVLGHTIADVNPLGAPGMPPPELNAAYYGLQEADLDKAFSTRTVPGAPMLTLRTVMARMRATYCRNIGVQYMHLGDLSVRWWLRDRMEACENRIDLPRDEQLRILTRLTDAVIFEAFLQKKYPGAKTFSLEGAESLIPLLDQAFERAAGHGVSQVVLAMAHRGRLNVLANIMRKSAKQIFAEFEDRDPTLHMGRGDVKYHLGYSTDWTTASGRTLHLSLCFNPSHLEFVNPVALGRMRAKLDRAGDLARREGLVVCIHGDAAFAGEGIVQETLNLSQLKGYSVGGALHIVVNNQVGFTTSPQEGRSSPYATDIAKMLEVPIFHVNGEDPEAVAQVVRLALDFRQAYRSDVVIDMYCYRRHGHNEGDEPSFTQPVLYRAIQARPSVRESYLEHLLRLGGVSREEADRIAAERQAELERELEAARREESRLPTSTLAGIWDGYRGGREPEQDGPTGVEVGRLSELLEAQTRLPEGFRPHPKIDRWLEARREMAQGKRPLDWSAGEALAFATLLAQGVRVRLSGQDSERGTFSHRHAVLHDYESGARHTPLASLAPSQGVFEVHNSPLSEAGVLGFEYGYSLDFPDALVLWEAQFGDFGNAAQVIIDQFISSAEDKWRRLSGLVLLLPHGFEGMGPEHSSARLERFLVLAADENIQVVYPTTPAQIFHCLRRQVLRPLRKPLVVMTPKSLLRSAAASSRLEELAQGSFQRVLDDPELGSPEKVRRILLCSGKIAYELLERRRELGRVGDVAILRLEQLYPTPLKQLGQVLSRYPEGVPARWVQEEPENMGAWRFLQGEVGTSLLGRHPLRGISRAASASPATGSASSHKLEQEELLVRAFGRS